MADNIVALHLSDPVKQKLERLSRVMKRDVSSLAQEALADYLVRQDSRSAAIDEAALAADSGEFVSHEAMSHWLESWGSDEESDPPKADVVKAKQWQNASRTDL